MADLEIPSQRRRLARELKKLRRAADLSTYELGRRLGVNQSRISRVENTRQPARVSEVDEWARVTGASDQQRQELVALAKDALVASPGPVERDTNLADLQRLTAELEASARLLRVYMPVNIPGLLQTPQYARQVYAAGHSPDRPGIAEAVAGRMSRQAALYDEQRRFEFVIPEAALRWRYGEPDVQLGQLDRIGVVSALPNVEIGLIPQDRPAPVWHTHGFNLFDERDEDPSLVHVEVLGSWVTVSDPEHVAKYRQAFDRLRKASVYDDGARSLLDRIAEDLRRGAST